MAKKKKSSSPWALDLDLDLADDIAQSWASKGFDIEEFYVPDVGAEAFRLVDDIDEEDYEEDDEHECRYIRPRMKPIPRRQVTYEKAAAFARELGLLQTGERIDTIISGKFIMGDFIEAYMVEHNLHTERLLISTLSYNENNVDSLRNLLEGGYVDRLDMVVSAYFFAHERQKLIRYAYEQLDNEDNRFQLAVCNVHSKTYQWRTDDGLEIVCHGSANLRAGANFENMIFEENHDTFKFFDDFYSEILRLYPTIQKDKKYLKTWFQPDYDDGKQQGEAQ